MSNQAPPANQPVKSHTIRNIILGIAVVLIVIVLFSVLWFLVLNPTGGGGILRTSHTVNIVNGLITVNAGSYEYYSFTYLTVLQVFRYQAPSQLPGVAEMT